MHEHDHGAGGISAMVAGVDWLALGGLPLVMLIAGLVGSLTHCVGMCGPFVLAQVGARLDRLPPTLTEFQRLTGAALAPYHLGRATTYIALGTVAGGVSGAIVAQLPHLRVLLAVALGMAALLFLVQGIDRLRRLLPHRPRPPGLIARLVSAAARPLVDDPRGVRGFQLGLVLGFLPCGLLYGALAAAAGSGSAAGGAIAMAAFTLGTVPVLIGIGWLGATAGRRWQSLARIAAGPLLLLNAGILALIAAETLGYL
ncbi:MAG: sulfite exporter TauE/SafE family protein [Alphaproteobacteria bacterium]|nr:sulfite exporter TauE/SafE family protein [Alphaproteobacteria bacterium]